MALWNYSRYIYCFQYQYVLGAIVSWVITVLLPISWVGIIKLYRNSTYDNEEHRFVDRYHEESSFTWLDNK